MKIRAKLSEETKALLKGEKGDKGDLGLRGFDGKDGYTPVFGVDYFNGKDGLDGKDGIQGLKGNDGSPDTPIQVRDKLETLKGQERLQITAINGLDDLTDTLDEFEKELKKLKKKKGDVYNIGGGGSSADLSAYLTTATADLTYLKLDTSNDPLTGTLSFSSALNGLDVLNLPTAQGTASYTDYYVDAGGGSLVGEDGIGSAFTFRFDDHLGDGGYNWFVVDLGKLEPTYGTPSGVVITGEARLFGNVSFFTGIAANAAVPESGFILSNDGTGPYAMVFDNTTGADGSYNVQNFKMFDFRFDSTTSVFKIDFTSSAATDADNGQAVRGFAKFNTPALNSNAPRFNRVLIRNDGAITHVTGDEVLWASLRVEEMNIINTAGTIPDTATIYVPAAATEGIRNYAFFADSGLSRFDDGFIVGGITGAAITGAAGVLTLAGFGNTNNENLTFNFEGTANLVDIGTGTGVTAIRYASGIAHRLGGTTGISMSAATGVLTLAGIGNTNNENLTLDFEGTANKVILNTGTGVTALQFNVGLEMNAKDISTDTTTGMKIGTGTTQKIGFYGTAPIVQGAALTAQLTTITHTAPATPDYALQDLVQGADATAGFGFVTKDEGNTLLSVVANLQARVAQLEARLGTATGVGLFV